MHFIDLAAQQKKIRDKIDGGIRNVLDHGKYIMGPEVAELENELARYVSAKHAVSCSSGTDALLLALMACGIGPGDAVFTTPFTFIATAEVIALLGATPVFVDIDRETFNIDPDQLEKAIAALKKQNGSSYPLPVSVTGAPLRARAIIPVDLFGLPADYDRINEIATRNELFVIEDAAQSFGGEYNGRKACSLGDIGCTSFFPAKPLGCYGDGGMCFTDNDNLADKMRSIRIHGKGTHKYDNVRIGMNGRMDTIQAAILLAKFEIFPEEVLMRNRAAGYYCELISRKAGSQIITPQVPDGCLSAWAQFSILVRNSEIRSGLQDKLKEKNIPTAVYYPGPLHLQTAFSGLEYTEGDFPISEDCSKRIFSLPMHPYLKNQNQEKIISALVE